MKLSLPLPDTLVGRTVMVLVLAVLVVLGMALAIFAGHRSEVLSSLVGRHAAERVAAIAHLLESTDPQARRSTLGNMDMPGGFRAGWGMIPLVQDQEESDDALALTVAEHLQSVLSGHGIRVSTRPPPEPPPPPDHIRHHGPGGSDGPGVGGGRGRAGGFGFNHGPALRIAVQLNDQSWLNVIAPLDGGGPLWKAGFALPLAGALVLVTGVALWAVRRAARPLGTFAAAAQALGVDVDATPIPVHGPREVRQAALAFNLMQTRIRNFVQDRTRMLAAISHDLRTPITRMRLRAEFMDDEVQRGKMLADLEEMEQMIAATLAFARDDAANEARQKVDLAFLVRDLCQDFQAAYDGPDHALVAVRPMAVKRAVSNLLGNAVAYGERADLSLNIGPDLVTLIIDDQGAGIPDDQLERVFGPFVRLEESRNRRTGGAGLGLSVARAAARAHGGDVILQNRPQGGLRAIMTLALPAASPP